MQNNLIYIITRKRLHIHNNLDGLVLKLTIKRKLMGMVDSQSCSDGNRIGLDGTGDEKEGEPMSFGVWRPEGNVIWNSATSLIFNTGQMEALLDWEITAPLSLSWGRLLLFGCLHVGHETTYWHHPLDHHLGFGPRRMNRFSHCFFFLCWSLRFCWGRISLFDLLMH